MVTIGVVLVTLAILVVSFARLLRIAMLALGMMRAAQEATWRRAAVWRDVGAGLGGSGSAEGIDASMDGRMRDQIPWARRLAVQLAAALQRMPVLPAGAVLDDPVAGGRRRGPEVLRA